MEPDLDKAKADISWADHLVFVYPVWWAAVPAILKGFIDRVFTPGFAFKSDPKGGFANKLLKGKTGRLIVTMDYPKWYYKWFLKRSSQIMMKKGVLDYCGIKPVKVTEFTPIKTASENQRLKWIQQTHELGQNLA